MISGSEKKVMLIGVAFFLVIMMFAAVGIGGGSSEDDIDLSTSLLSEAVERYRPYVTKRAEVYDMADHVELILCVMEVESHGEGMDPMQAAEGPFNKEYPKVPNGIRDPEYSIDCGIQELRSVLKKAGVKSGEDKERIKVALAGYNFGSGYIEWVDANKGGKWTLENAKEFSAMMAAKMGWSVYGDPNYVDKVMEYYETAAIGIEGKDAFLVPMKSYTLTSSVGQRSLGDYHYGTDIDGGYGANIYAPAAGIVYEVSNDCPPCDGYLGNSCPYSGGYIGGGNYVMLKVTNKKEDYYVFLCHMKRTLVSKGQKVKKGQKIGEQGHSGNSTASHLHIEIHKGTAHIATKDGLVDPEKIMNFKKR
ncbi:MAG: lysozyme family protein [Anaerovoracaceae bacterium]